MGYLLDTNICIYIIKKKPTSVMIKLEKIINNSSIDDLFISSITVAELFYGAEKSTKRDDNIKALKGFLSPFKIIDFDSSSAEVFGNIRRDLEKKGKPIGPYDLQIASIAFSNNLVLVTNNVREFERISDLVVENWVD